MQQSPLAVEGILYACEKYYVADNGLRKAVLYSQGPNEGKSLETVVHSSLLRGLGSEDRLFYFNDNGSECDFLVQKGSTIFS